MLGNEFEATACSSLAAEAEGASEQARKLANERLSIPMAGDVGSLNAGVAGSVLMFEVVRQRK
ncbi:MAG: TrmH family RNA methyltransferase [Anaerolineales bacterium]